MAEQTPTTPWPQNWDGDILFIKDVAHEVEERHLADWIDQSNQASVPAHRISLSIDDYRGNLQPLAQVLETLPPESMIVPLRVVWTPVRGNKPRKPMLRDLILGDPRYPRPWRARRILRKYPQSVARLNGAGATLGELRQRFAALHPTDNPDTSSFAAFVVRQAALALDVAERHLTGVRYKVPRFVNETLQSRPDFQADLARLAEETGRPLPEIRQQAREYLREMVARPNTFFIDMMGVTSRFMASLGYEKDIVCDQAELVRMREIMLDHPSAVLWSHKSYVDGSAVMSLLYDHDFPTQHAMGGVNMDFAGIGFLSRKAGVIFIRRSFQDNPVYKAVLRQYLGFLMEKRFPFSWAFEGTRSRTGKLMPPRLGILKYVMEAAQATGARNLHLIPVSVSYDLITDVADYAAEQAGVKKKAESLGWFISYLRRLRQPMGRIYLNFGEPVVVAEPTVGDDVTLPKIAFEVATRVNAVSPITQSALICTILLGAAPQALTLEELSAEAVALLRWARKRNIPMASSFDVRDNRVAALAETIVEQKLISRYDEGPDVVYGIHPDRHGQAGYYRNTIIHNFLHKAMAELALARVVDYGGADTLQGFWRHVRYLRDLFKFEFFYPPSKDFEADIDTELQAADPHWQQGLDQKPAHARTLLANMPFLICNASLLPYLEAYTVMADVLSKPDNPQQDQKACVSLALRWGRQAYLQRRISSQASLSRQVFANGWQAITGAAAKHHRPLVDHGVATSRELRAIGQRLRRIRHLAAELRGGEAQD